MHLSFVGYDRPEEKRVYLSGLEDKSTPVQTSTWLDSYDIGANGFLRPYLFQREVPLPKPDLKQMSSFSAAGNKAATPGRAKVVQEYGQARQLISGRNFRDILEACRPRVLGASLPTPLESLLSLKQYAQEIDKAKESDTQFVARKRFNDVDVRLREWGTLDLNEFRVLPFPRESRGNSPIPSATYLINPHKRVGSKSDKSDDASIASSPGSSKYGTSYDRLFWDYYEVPKTPTRAFHIQRSQSLEFDIASKRSYVEPTTNEDFFAGSVHTSRRSTAGGSDMNLLQESESDRHTEILKKIMDSYDSLICAPHTQENGEADDRSYHSDSGITGESNLVSTLKSGGVMKTL
jgi:hypothetical protein